MKTGFQFTQDGTHYVVIKFDGDKNHNIALILRQTESDCPYISVKDLTPMTNGDYCWFHGQYFKDFDYACAYHRGRVDAFRNRQNSFSPPKRRSDLPTE